LFAVDAISSGKHVVHPNPFWVIIAWAITLAAIGVPCFFAGRRHPTLGRDDRRQQVQHDEADMALLSGPCFLAMSIGKECSL
jgi:hypothetical protein